MLYNPWKQVMEVEVRYGMMTLDPIQWDDSGGFVAIKELRTNGCLG